MLDEVEALAGIADDFIAPESKNVLPRFHGQLEGYRNSGTRDAFDWKIDESNPLSTIKTKGYEPGAGGQRFLVGQITAKWRIKKEPTPKKSMPAKFFYIAGLASTRVRIRCVGEANELCDQIAMWRMEIGDAKAPGCFFHSQILGETDEFPFPHSLPVPRLPILSMSTASVVEFMLGELFQDRWGPQSALQVPHLNRWAPIQSERFRRLLDWKLSVLNNNTGSPWPSLKAAKPSDDIFI